MLDNPKFNLEFLTISILGLINEIDWFPPVFAVIITVLIGSEFISSIVSESWNLRLLTLLIKYTPVLNPVAPPSYNTLSPVLNPWLTMLIWFVSTLDEANNIGSTINF